MSEDYSAAADWAERDMTPPQESTSTLRGRVATDFGRDLLERAGCRPGRAGDADDGQVKR
ncbi:MAG: hypothetical protein ACYCXA_11965 [Actinomycetes bacterium]